MRVSEDVFYGLVGVLRPRLPLHGFSAEVRTALALHY